MSINKMIPDFSQEELNAIQTDTIHILRSVTLPEHEKYIRISLIVKINNAGRMNREVFLGLHFQEHFCKINDQKGVLHIRIIENKKYVMFVTDEEAVYGLDFSNELYFMLVKQSRKGKVIKEQIPYENIEFCQGFWEKWLGIQ